MDVFPEGHYNPQSFCGGPLLVVLSGPSGVGKDMVLSSMRQRGNNWHFVVTATTRPQRPGERDGVDYVFLTPERFQEMLRQGQFLEHAQVYGCHYGVPRQQVADALAQGRDVLVKTDVQGAASLRKAVPDAVLVFLAPPSLEELEQRLRQRKTDSPEQLALRLQAARREIEQLPHFDYVIVNHNGRIQETVATLEAVVTAERCRIPPRRVRL